MFFSCGIVMNLYEVYKVTNSFFTNKISDKSYAYKTRLTSEKLSDTSQFYKALGRIFLTNVRHDTGYSGLARAAAEGMIEADDCLYAVEASLRESHFRIKKCLLRCQHFQIRSI